MRNGFTYMWVYLGSDVDKINLRYGMKYIGCHSSECIEIDDYVAGSTAFLKTYRNPTKKDYVRVILYRGPHFAYVEEALLKHFKMKINPEFINASAPLHPFLADPAPNDKAAVDAQIETIIRAIETKTPSWWKKLHVPVYVPRWV